MEPRTFLQSIRRLLAPDGVLLVLVPNVDSLAVRILAKAVTFAGDWRVNHFSPGDYRTAAGIEPLAVADCETLLTEVGTINGRRTSRILLGDAPRMLDVVAPECLPRNDWAICCKSWRSRPSVEHRRASGACLMSQLPESCRRRCRSQPWLCPPVCRPAGPEWSTALCPIRNPQHNLARSRAARRCGRWAYLGKSRIGHSRSYTRPPSRSRANRSLSASMKRVWPSSGSASPWAVETDGERSTHDCANKLPHNNSTERTAIKIRFIELPPAKRRNSISRGQRTFPYFA